jgi:glycosyltransferase involved in cell wall biosynthesis
MLHEMKKALRINQLLCDESLRQRMGENGRKLVEANYSLDVKGKETL